MNEINSETETLILLIEVHPIFWTQLQDNNKTYLEQVTYCIIKYTINTKHIDSYILQLSYFIKH